MGEPDCKHDAGAMLPVIDRNRCEGKEDCVRAWPYDVFAMGRIGPEERRGLGVVGRLKAFAHRGRQAFAVLPATLRRAPSRWREVLA